MLSLLAAGCVSGGDTGETGNTSNDPPEVPNAEGEGGTREALASSTTTSTNYGPDLRIDVYSLERVSEDMVVLDLGIHNVSSGQIDVTRPLADNGTAASAHRVTLVDVQNMKRYYPLEDTSGECYCSTWTDQRNLAGGDSIEAWVAYPAPPGDVDSVSVHTPVTTSFPDIPITEGEDPDLPDADLAEPTILDLHHLVEDLEDGTGRDESGEGVAISLSADVLFDLNESTLTDDAQAILEDIATEIDESDASVIRIDGHTDSSGTDAINDPLSEDRAESVREALEELVTRSGISYETAGHGSSDPIGDNDTEEGRQQNRRVTVTIAS